MNGVAGLAGFGHILRDIFRNLHGDRVEPVIARIVAGLTCISSKAFFLLKAAYNLAAKPGWPHDRASVRPARSSTRSRHAG